MGGAPCRRGGITIIPPDGRTPGRVPTDDMMPTNICFGGDDLRTAYIPCSMTGRLVSCRWETPGLPLNFLNRWQDPTRTGQPMRT